MMNDRTTFGAPWGRPLKLMTWLSAVILVGISVIGISSGPRDSAVWILCMVAMPLCTLVIAAFFAIRGFVLSGEALFVLRPGWSSKLPLTDLRAAEVDPEAMTRSIRTFGNGGIFCFAGAFRNKKIGTYRAFATDPKRSVILKFSDRTVVVTPDNPADFVARIRELKGLGSPFPANTCLEARPQGAPQASVDGKQ